LLAEIPITTIASTLLAVEETVSNVEEAEILELTFVVAIAFGAIHIFYDRLHHLLYKEERIAISFGGGMAIAYIFLHLLPELEKGEQDVGSPIHFITLLGFLLFYGMQRFAWSVSKNEASKSGDLVFYIQLGFSSVYNFLLIYAIPELFETNLLFVFLYVVAIGFHLMHNDHSLGEKYHHQFNSWGRYVLLGAVAVGLAIDIFAEPANELVADVLTAMLAGSLLFNVFQEELPEPEHTSFRWFVAGVVVYVILLLGSMSLS
jgi:predicted membrane channel-forming protein YqfA (hemolysin III family)